jgi:hypothetical protein
VTCTATDTSNNTASCSFLVTVFNICIQDDSNPNNVLVFITSGAQTGRYRSVAMVDVHRVGTVKESAALHLVASAAGSPRAGTLNIDGTGTASLQAPPGVFRCTITDRPNIRVHT